MARKKPKTVHRLQRKKGLYLTDWMAMQPHEVTPGPLEAYYLEVAREVLLLMREMGLLKNLGSPWELEKRIALSAAGYLEDQVSRFGLWRAVVEHNKEKLGYYLPFYESDADYDPSGINARDISLLLWHALCDTQERPLINPLDPAILGFGEAVADYFEELLEEEPPARPEFYDSFFHVDERTDLVTVKTKMGFLSERSYLLNWHAGEVVEAELKKLRMGLKNPPPPPDVTSMIVYAEIDRIIYSYRSPFGAISLGEVLARIARATEENRAYLRVLNESQRIQGIFHLQRADKQYTYLRNEQTQQEFPVRSDSFTQRLPTGSHYIMSIIRFRDEWWFTGGAFGWPEWDEESRRSNPPKPLAFVGRPPEQQQLIRQATEDQEAFFRKYFGGSVVIFPDAAVAQKAVFDMLAAFREGKERSDEDLAAVQQRARQQGLVPLDEQLKNWGEEDEPMAVYFDPGVGIVTWQGMGPAVKLLRKKKLTPQQQTDLFYELASETPPTLSRFLLDKYAPPHFLLEIPLTPGVDQMPYIEYWMRFLQPESFEPPVPTVVLV